MKINIDRELKKIEAKRVRIETDKYIFEFTVCPATGNLKINKVDGADEGAIIIYSRYSNEIEVK